MLKAMADNEQEISVEQDAAMYDSFAQYSNYIFNGIGNEMGVSYSSNSLIVTLKTGGAVIRGRHVYENTAEGVTTLSLNPNTNGYLVVRYDLTQASGNEAKFLAVTVTLDENINADGNISDLVLGSFTTDSRGVTSFKDLRKIGSGIPKMAIMTESEYNRLSVKDSNTLYFLTE